MSTRETTTGVARHRGLGIWLAFSYLGYVQPFDALDDNRALAAGVAIGAIWLLTVVNVLSSILITGLAVLNDNASLVGQFTFVILLATLTTLIPYVFPAAAQLMLLITDRARFEAKRRAGHAIIALLALAYAIWTVAGSGYEVAHKGLLLLLLGIPVYVWMKYASARRGGHVVATGVAESVAAHGDELHLPADLDAALATVIADEQRTLATGRK